MLYVVSHKNVHIPELDSYIPIQVGSAAENFAGFIRDNTGDNIAEKNPNYCELTALYWIWKNTEDSHKGIVHYRRYFGRRPRSNRVEDICTYDELLAGLAEKDIVLAKPQYFHVNAEKELCITSATPDTFRKLRQTVEQVQPDSLEAFDRFFRGNTASLYNVLFCRRELFDAYCEWLFSILFELEGKLDLTSMNDYQKRVYGFLAERLLNVWVMYRDLRIQYFPVVNTEMRKAEILTVARRDVTNNIRFHLGGKK